ncbi:MAG TPA: hypothetical protein VJ714_06945, partial [Anaerolineae bacterium]|nr:hypothetical protein [Anaerolineae bacterium]
MSRVRLGMHVQATDRLERQALEWGAALVGFADLSEVAPPSFRAWPRAVSVAMALDDVALAGVRDGPTAAYHHEYQRVNRRLNELAERISESIRSLGHLAEPFPATIPEGREADEWVKTLSVSFQHKTAAT